MSPKPIPAGIQIAPSLLAADFAALTSEIDSIKAGGVEMLHLDVMDGHFVPNITFGPPLVRSIRGATNLFLDTHLMISDPLAFLKQFHSAGSNLLTLHAETLSADKEGTPTSDSERDFQQARGILNDLDCLLGLSFRPGTDPFPWLERFGAELDLVLVMTVNPGFGGQSFMTEMVERIEQIKALKDDRGYRYRLQVDGGVNQETAKICLEAGAEILVAGNAVFKESDRAAAIGEMLHQ